MAVATPSGSWSLAPAVVVPEIASGDGSLAPALGAAPPASTVEGVTLALSVEPTGAAGVGRAADVSPGSEAIALPTIDSVSSTPVYHAK